MRKPVWDNNRHHDWDGDGDCGSPGTRSPRHRIFYSVVKSVCAQTSATRSLLGLASDWVRRRGPTWRMIDMNWFLCKSACCCWLCRKLNLYKIETCFEDGVPLYLTVLVWPLRQGPGDRRAVDGGRTRKISIFDLKANLGSHVLGAGGLAGAESPFRVHYIQSNGLHNRCASY